MNDGNSKQNLLGRGLLMLAAALLCACQTSQRKAFETVKVGMDKAIIVETVGSPTITHRSHGQDHWIYKFRDGRPEDYSTREVHFQNGLAVYVGAPLTPRISAAEQDRINDELAAQEQARYQVFANARENHLGGQSGMTSEPEDAISRKIRQSIYGIEPSKADEKRKQAPVFVPVQ